MNKKYVALTFADGPRAPMIEMIDKFTAVSAEEKLVLWLLEQAEFNNPIPMSVSYARLAEILDLGRSSLYRAMDALEAEGILRKEKKLLTILDMEALHHWPEK